MSKHYILKQAFSEAETIQCYRNSLRAFCHACSKLQGITLALNQIMKLQKVFSCRS